MCQLSATARCPRGNLDCISYGTGDIQKVESEENVPEPRAKIREVRGTTTTVQQVMKRKEYSTSSVQSKQIYKYHMRKEGNEI